MIVDSIERKILNQEIDITKLVSNLINGERLVIRKEIAMTQGHKLEDMYKNQWPELNSVRNQNYGDSALKRDIINTVINDFPGLLSKDIAETLRAFK